MTLTTRNGFDWDHVAWSKPHSRIAPLCSYCSAGIADDDVPLMLWREDGTMAHFCDDCMVTYFGFAPPPLLDLM